MNIKSLTRYIFFVTFICYIPHIATEPWWLFVIFLAAITYRLMADYFNLPLLSRWIRFLLVIGFLVLLSQTMQTSGFIIRFLLIFIFLKCIEIHRMRDLKVLILCNFLIIFAALIVIQEVWIIGYLLIAIIANLSAMLKLNTSQVSLLKISGKSTKQLLIAIPLSILLFYIFPRIEPLWHLSSSSSASTGFNDTMNLGSIAELFNDDTEVMKVTSKKNLILNGYWRGIILSFYTGESWNQPENNAAKFFPLQELRENDQASFEILLEPNQTKWLFYLDNPIAGSPSLLFSPNVGLTRQNKEIIKERFIYSLKIQPVPYQNLNSIEFANETQLPNNTNLRLIAWSKQQFENSNRNVQTFIDFLHQYIHQQPFWYTLKPQTLDLTKNQMDSFWFDTQQGFCEHYASAVTFILRSVGIPARIIVGYQGGEWNPIANAIIIRKSDAHAWLEYWKEGMGWQQLDPTTFIALERIDQSIRIRQMLNLNLRSYNISNLSWQQKIKFLFDSMRLYSERWFLFYNQYTQKNLLHDMGLGRWNRGQLIQISVGIVILFFILFGFYYQWWKTRRVDSLLFEYYLLQKEFRRFNVSISPSSTLKTQCQSLINTAPILTTLIYTFLDQYEQLRLKPTKNNTNENKKETISLFKSLRHALRRHLAPVKEK